MLLLNLLLALAWLALTGEFTIFNFLVGLLAAAALLALVQRALPRGPVRTQTPAYGLKALQMVAFVLFFLWELILANIRVAIDVLRPTPQIEPAVVAVPLAGFSDAEATLLANFITLTPGTLSLDVSDSIEVETGDQERVLYVHAMHAGRTQEAIEQFRTQLQQNLGRRVTEVMR